MGNSNSRDSVNDRESISRADVREFIEKLERTLKDPSYSNGVNTQSILDMVSDIFTLCRKGQDQIRLPLPIDKIAPMTHIVFKKSMVQDIGELRIKKKKKRHSSSLNKQTHESRLRQQYNIANDIETSTIKVPSDRNSDIIDEINNSISQISIGSSFADDKQVDEEYDLVEESSDRGISNQLSNTNSERNSVDHIPRGVEEDTIVMSDYGPRRIRRHG